MGKMAVVKDFSLFELMEKAGPRLVHTKFGTSCPEDAEFGQLCDLIIGKAMEGYVKSEYGNLWETHQCRPHATATHGHLAMRFLLACSTVMPWGLKWDSMPSWQPKKT